MVDRGLSKYYWIIGVVIVTIIATLFIIFALIMPSINSVNKINKDLTVSKENLSVLKTKLEKLKELKVKESELKDQEAVVNRAIPTKKEVGELFIQLEGIISDAGGTTKGISEGTSGSGSSGSTQATASTGVQTVIPGVNSANYSYEVTFANYENFKKFLATAENSLRYIQLNSFTVKGGNSFVVGLNYKAYYRDASQSGQSTSEGAK